VPVIDASVLIAALAPDEFLDDAISLIDPYWEAGCIAPDILPFEVANAFLMKQRRGLISPASAEEAWSLVARFPVELVKVTTFAIGDLVAPLAMKHQLSIYDALYLHLALARRQPLATRDKALMAAATREGLTVL